MKTFAARPGRGLVHRDVEPHHRAPVPDDNFVPDAVIMPL
jgi:hypothetical protein